MTLKRCEDLKTWELDGEAVVYDGKSGMGHVLNPTALQIWSLCDGNRSTSDIECLLMGNYPEQRGSIPQDVREAVRRLTDIGLIQAA